MNGIYSVIYTDPYTNSTNANSVFDVECFQNTRELSTLNFLVYLYTGELSFPLSEDSKKQLEEMKYMVFSSETDDLISSVLAFNQNVSDNLLLEFDIAISGVKEFYSFDTKTNFNEFMTKYAHLVKSIMIFENNINVSYSTLVAPLAYYFRTERDASGFYLEQPQIKTLRMIKEFLLNQHISNPVSLETAITTAAEIFKLDPQLLQPVIVGDVMRGLFKIWKDKGYKEYQFDQVIFNILEGDFL